MNHGAHVLVDTITRFISLTDLYKDSVLEESTNCLADWFADDSDDTPPVREFQTAVIKFLTGVLADRKARGESLWPDS